MIYGLFFSKKQIISEIPIDMIVFVVMQNSKVILETHLFSFSLGQFQIAELGEFIFMKRDGNTLLDELY